MELQRFIRISGVAIGLGLVAACEPAPTSPAPAVPAVVTSIQARSPLHLLAVPCESIVQLPVVAAYGSGREAVNTPVTFSHETPAGVRTTYSMRTDARGLASPPSWQLGCESGQYRIIASAGDGLEVVFTAHAKGAAVAVYDLVSVDDGPIPPHYRPSQYVLFDDGSFSHLWDGKPTAWSGWYRADAAGWLVFNLMSPCDGAWYREQNCIFATGKVEGGTLTMAYTDWLNFNAETYRKRD